jgi:hypothetical protein
MIFNPSLVSFACFMMDQESIPQNGNPCGNAYVRVHHVIRAANRAAAESDSPLEMSLDHVSDAHGKRVVGSLILFNSHTHKTRTVPMSVTENLVRLGHRPIFVGENSKPSSLLIEMVAEIESTLAEEDAA